MVCLASEGTVIAIVRDTIGGGPKRQSQITLAPSKSVSSVFTEICADFHYEVDEIELLIQYTTGEVIILNHHREKTLGEINVIFDQSIRNTIVISGVSKSQKPMTLIVHNDNNDDDLLLGASASPTAGDIPSNLTSDPPPALMSIGYPNICDYRPLQEPWNYVGLVNQAMTCYLNSLLQALYMTPEFRNALYNWEFDGQGEAKSIPFQLQKLFLNLQTSTKSSVETTELTRSFGWDLSEAWQQHDVQELCRVMFDALEKKFENTSQANLINDLYQGKLLDYVKCLECGTEKSREDSLLDIPLPVRPFGRSVAYNSVEEALRGFVQPETLEGNNQYFCEKCNKKCNAHKGLKFTKFPYLLTLHLKRFDFDYTTMNRIKLNDKVVFPEMLNLNSFIPSTAMVLENETIEERETIKCDDCSTTDSGSVLDDETSQCNDVPPTVNGGSHIIHEDEDEGIDVGCINNQENKKSDKNEPKGPYLYELFSIMIHAGSASGGHYYAYIKDFEKNQWLCFNDQIVNRITEDDIQKTYGGGPARYYSGQYSSSTNAYMLMYRQVDQQRNCNFMTVDEFPQHITHLLQQMQEKEENDRLAKEREHDMLKLKVYCWHPIQNVLVDVKLFVFLDSTLVSEVAANAHQRFKLEGIVSLDDCRLVAYDKLHDYIECSFDDDLKFCDINPNCEWLLETKPPESKFQVYKPGGVIMRTFLIDLEEEELDGPHIFYVNQEDTVYDVKTRLADMFHLNINTMRVVQHMHYKEPFLLDDDEAPIKFESRSSQYKLYVSNSLEEEPEKTFLNSKLKKAIELFTHVISVDMVLPDTDISRLEAMSIPALDRNHNIEKVDYGGGDRVVSKSPLVNSSCELLSDQCNSEDSSLSDSDRTLVGDAPGDCIGLLSSTSISPADQHMASPIDPAEDTYNHDIFDSQPEEMSWDDVSSEPQVRIVNQYFKAKLMSTSTSNLCNEADATQYLKVQVDKRMPLVKLKKHLEPFVGVPIEYFKIFRLYPHEAEITKLIDTLGTTKDGDRLSIKLGRVLKKNEYVGKVFRLTPENSEVLSFMFEFVIASGQLVGQIKKDILIAAKKQHMLDISFNNCRLRAKSWKNPLKVYLDEQRFGEDIILNNNWEMYLQELGDGEIVKDPNQLCLFVKRWCPSTLTLTPFHEIVLNVPTVMELKTALALESGIPVDNLEVAFLKGAFPCDINVLDIQDLDWNVKVNFLENYPLQIYQDGSVFLYRDSREVIKVISPEERKEINNRENTRLGKYSSKTYSPRRETALKIYLDSPIKSEEVCLD